MAEPYLVVVDMQNDFVDGSLGTKEAQGIVSKTVEKASGFPGKVLFTGHPRGGLSEYAGRENAAGGALYKGERGLADYSAVKSGLGEREVSCL